MIEIIFSLLFFQKIILFDTNLILNVKPRVHALQEMIMTN